MDIQWTCGGHGAQNGVFCDAEGRSCGVWTSNISGEERLMLDNLDSEGAIKLTRAHAATLLPHIQRWVDGGELIPADAEARA